MIIVWNPQGHSEAILELVHQKNVIKSIFSYINLLYVIGKVKVCALRICNCFLGLRVILTPFLKLVEAFIEPILKIVEALCSARTHFETHQLNNTKYIQKRVRPLLCTSLVPHLRYLRYKHKSTSLLRYQRQSVRECYDISPWFKRIQTDWNRWQHQTRLITFINMNDYMK